MAAPKSPQPAPVVPITLEEALAMPRPKRGVPCEGYAEEHRQHPEHHMRRPPIRAPHMQRSPYGRPNDPDPELVRYQRWHLVTDGKFCSMCEAVYDPTPLCEQETDYDGIWKIVSRCDSVARHREVGAIRYQSVGDLREHAKGKQEHNYCGKHAPSKIREREASRHARSVAKMNARAEAAAPGREREDSRTALLAEARRWRDDEAATGEGFCPEEDHCEHHECRLARAVARLERAEEFIRTKRTAELRDAFPTIDNTELAEWVEEELED